MRKRTKFFLLLFLISFALTMAMAGALVLTGAVYHRESHETVALPDAQYENIAFDTSLASVTVAPSDEGKTEAEVSVYAWRGEAFHAAEQVRLDIKDGVLTLTELPFPMDFLGFFPQPYAMNITLNVPLHVYEAWQKEAQP